KGCKAECPTAVDVARVKAEFLAHYQAEHGVPLRSRVFGEIRALSRMARPFAPLLRALASTGLVRRLQERMLGVARQRELPAFQSATFESRLNDVGEAGNGPPIVLFLDTYTNYHEPELGLAAVRVLRALGHHVVIETKQACCGRPMISKGLLGRARESAQKNLEVLGGYAEQGTPIVGLEPSCILTLRDEYLEFFPDNPSARALAEGSYLLEEYLVGVGQDGRRRVDELPLQGTAAEKVLLHAHCHAKSLVGAAPTRDMLQAAGYDVRVLDTGCCGMAGSFGYEVEHYDLSQQIGELVLFPAVRAANGRHVAAHGTSCRTQIHDGTGVEAQHPVQLLAKQLA
ncbi:MAG: heterodisulfide reductase-related iron-sulfur binding cluster, partial [Anaerolineales bacterium]|nr:heterodisulfide reductase-related iron-sulfur binding cluster [Anaerolineales bacterium]